MLNPIFFLYHFVKCCSQNNHTTTIPHYSHTTPSPYQSTTIPHHSLIDLLLGSTEQLFVVRTVRTMWTVRYFEKVVFAVRCFHKSGVSTEQCEKANSEHWNSRISLMTIVWPRINLFGSLFRLFSRIPMPKFLKKSISRVSQVKMICLNQLRHT